MSQVVNPQIDAQRNRLESSLENLFVEISFCSIKRFLIILDKTKIQFFHQKRKKIKRNKLVMQTAVMKAEKESQLIVK